MGTDLYEGGATCEGGARTTASPLTRISVWLDCVVTHVVDNDGCVLRTWDRIDTDSWTRGLPAHRNRRQSLPTCGDIFGEWQAPLEQWSKPERSSVASARRPTGGNDRSGGCPLSRRVEEREMDRGDDVLGRGVRVGRQNIQNSLETQGGF